jgi:hypothetical protein
LNTLAIGAVVVVAAVGLLVLILRSRGNRVRVTAFTPNPTNDTVVICKGWDEAELKKILTDFARMYELRLPADQQFRIEHQRGQFQIRFPNDIEPMLLSTLVNYLQYPRDFDLASHQILVVGIVTLTTSFPIPSEDYVGKKARIYVPSNDKRYDEVYIAVGSEYFRQPFTNMTWKASTDGRIPDGIEALS